MIPIVTKGNVYVGLSSLYGINGGSLYAFIIEFLIKIYTGISSIITNYLVLNNVPFLSLPLSAVFLILPDKTAFEKIPGRRE